MRSVTQLQGLGDMRTAISTHSRSASRQKGTTYLEILSLGMEKLRLETELEWLTKRQRRIERRLGEIRLDMQRSVRKIQPQDTLKACPPASDVDESRQPGDGASEYGRWRKVTIDY